MIKAMDSGALEVKDGKDAFSTLSKLLPELFRQKQNSRSWSEYTIKITFKEGKATLLRITDDVTRKFD